MKVNSREKIFIIVGVVAVIGVLLFYGTTTLLPDYEGLSQKVELKKRLLRSQRETLTRHDTYKTRVEQYKKQLDQDKTKFLPGDSATLAGVELQKVLRNYADQIGVDITSSSILPEKKIQDIATKVSVRMDAMSAGCCTPDQLVHLLASIQNHEKLLIVDEMNINGMNISGIRGVPKKYEIRFSLTISGFINAPEEKPQAIVPGKTKVSNVS